MPTLCSACGMTSGKCQSCTRPDLAPPVDCRRVTIRTILLQHGFKIKPGETDLKNYVYDAVEAVIVGTTDHVIKPDAEYPPETNN